MRAEACRESWDVEACDTNLISEEGRGLEIKLDHMGHDSVNYADVIEPQ